MGQWIVGVISFQKKFGAYGLKGHIVEKMWDVTIVTDGRKCEDRARIREAGFAKTQPKLIEDTSCDT